MISEENTKPVEDISTALSFRGKLSFNALYHCSLSEAQQATDASFTASSTILFLMQKQAVAKIIENRYDSIC